MEAPELHAHRVVSGLNYTYTYRRNSQRANSLTMASSGDPTAGTTTASMQATMFYSPVREPQTIPDFIVMLMYRAFPASVICFFHGALFPSFVGIIEILIGILLVAYKHRIISRFYKYWRWVIVFFLLRLLKSRCIFRASKHRLRMTWRWQAVVVIPRTSTVWHLPKIQSNRQVSSIVLLLNVMSIAR